MTEATTTSHQHWVKAPLVRLCKKPAIRIMNTHAPPYRVAMMQPEIGK